MSIRALQQNRRLAHPSRSFLGALMVLLTASALADSTTLTLSDASKGASSAPVTMQFPVTRSGDLAYDAVLNYYTVDGTAQAGTDYAASSGTVVIPAGASSAMVPITLNPNTSSGADLSFGLLTSGSTGVGPAASFAAPQTFLTGNYPVSSAASDLNGDGKPDLVIVNRGDNTVSVLLNTTAPGTTATTFAAQQTFAVGQFARSVTTADVNGDGKADLIITSADTSGADGIVSVLLNTTDPGAATPSFAAQQPFSTFGFGEAPTSAITADVNGDGKPDIIVSNFCCSTNTVAVLLNTTPSGASAPSFAAAQIFAVGSDGRSVFVGDINDDGLPDLAVVSFNDNTVYVLLNTTAPGATTVTLTAPQPFSTGTSPTSVALGDINGDGKLDMLVSNSFGRAITAFINTTTPGASTPSFGTPQTFVTGVAGFPSFAFVRLDDVNGDGKLDAIVTNDQPDSVSVLLNITVPGATSANFAEQQMYTTGAYPEGVTVVDLNGDGKVDLVTPDWQDNTVSVLLNTAPSPTAAAPAFAAEQPFSAGSGSEFVATTDINGDGKRDLVVANPFDNSASVLINTTVSGAATSSFATQQTFATGKVPRFVAVSDLNGDGRPDLVVANFNDSSVSVLFNTTVPGAATPSFAVQQAFATGNNPRSITITDVNGDGKADVIVANQSGGQGVLSVLLNTAAPGATIPSFATQQPFVVADFGTPFSVAAADVNGDGIPDLIAADINEQAVDVLLNTTAPGAMTASFTTAQSFTTGANAHSVVVADVNGDGKADLVVANDTDNTVSVLLNATSPGATTPSFAAQQTFATGNTPFSVTAADVDGDGKLDLIVANTNDSTISVLLNTTVPGAATPSFAAQQTFTTGMGPYTVTTADINGDGKPDLIGANSGDNTVSVLLNTQYQVLLTGSPAIGTIVHDYIFANGFE